MLLGNISSQEAYSEWDLHLFQFSRPRCYEFLHYIVGIIDLQACISVQQESRFLSSARNLSYIFCVQIISKYVTKSRCSVKEMKTSTLMNINKIEIPLIIRFSYVHHLSIRYSILQHSDRHVIFLSCFDMVTTKQKANENDF